MSFKLLRKSKFFLRHLWLSVMTDLKNRGLEDIFIACIDGLTSFSDAIATIYPKTEIQRCIVHMVRNSLKYVPHKNKKEVAKDLIPITKNKLS